MLLRDAMKVSHQRTKTAVIVVALQDMIRKGRLQDLRRFKGHVNLDLNLNVVRKRT